MLTMCIDSRGSSLLVVVVEGLAGTASAHYQKLVIFLLSFMNLQAEGQGDIGPEGGSPEVAERSSCPDVNLPLLDSSSRD